MQLLSSRLMAVVTVLFSEKFAALYILLDVFPKTEAILALGPPSLLSRRYRGLFPRCGGVKRQGL
jgi:hypothetical protein